MNNRFTYFLVAGVLMFMTSCGNKTNGNDNAPDTIDCRTITVWSEPLESNWYYVGEVSAKTKTSVSFNVPGLVKRVYVKPGDYVTKGQLLAELDPTDIKNSFDIAAAARTQALDAQKRVRMMHDEQSVADIKFVEVETKVEQAKSAYAEAKKRLDDTKLHAPVSGVIDSRAVEPGENTMLDVAAFCILNVNTVSIKVPVPEGEISKVSIGDRAKVTVPALGDAAIYDVIVNNIGVSSNPVSHTYDVYLDVNNSDGRLKAGMVCNVKIWPKSMSGNKGFILPVSCVNMNSQSQHYIWLVRNGKATRQIVSIGSYVENGIEITEGLRDGDKVITEGLAGLSEGNVIRENKTNTRNLKKYFE